MIGIDAEELANQPAETRTVLIEPWLHLGELCLIYAERGIGKTWLGMDLSYALSTGGSTGAWKVLNKARVLYIDGEMGTEAIGHRYRMIRASHTSRPEPGTLRFLTQHHTGGVMWNLSTSDGQKRAEEIIKDYDVIVLDNLMTVTRRADRFDDPMKVWERMQMWLIRLRDLGKTVILFHHTNKDGVQSGTKDKENINDIIIALNTATTESSHEGARFLMTFEKTRHVTSIPQSVWTLHSGSGKLWWVVKSLDDARGKYIRKLREKGWTDGDIAHHLEISKSFVKELVMRLEVSELPVIPPNEIPEQDSLF